VTVIELLEPGAASAPLAVFLLAALAGAGLGALFFSGLWWTARRGTSSPNPALWFFCSMLLRMAFTLTGFYVVAGGNWERMLACLSGFAAARMAVTWLTRPTRLARACGPERGRNAP
jgi:F1F0 ATPase subunit 2